MKKIINGRKYDTETAKELGYWCNGYNLNDFDYEEETLYQKKNGEFFIFGQGGARSAYSGLDGNWHCAGSAIIPIDEERAKQWAEQNLKADEYEKIFGEVEE